MADTESQDPGGPSAIVDYDAQEREDNERWPNRPRNHADTLPFRTLYQDLFDPLIESRKSSTGPQKRQGGRGAHENRRTIIERYISRWRKEVGNDFYPALRLILPDKDRNRAMYGLKEKVIARYILKILKVDKNSDDGYNLLNFKQPGKGSSRNAGDFPGRAYEVLQKRPFRTEPGNMTILEVNDLLDQLARSSKEEYQLPVIEQFYRQMNPDELKWLICIILRIMHVGATERTIFGIWHPDADRMFNISSSLKRVCWELWSTDIRLESEENQEVTPGECFQPQLAQFVPKRIKSIIANMVDTEGVPEFWIEEKLDGERMQLHMMTVQVEGQPPHKEFKFWSRNAKDYTYLYGSKSDDPKSALTRHLTDVFDEGVESIILDGEMITWDMDTDKIVPFGTLKTAALEHQQNAFSSAPRPLYRVFDVLHLNGKDLTRYDLRTRRKDVLERVVRPVHRRLEVLEYSVGKAWDDIETALRKVVAEASEGLVVKNPRSMYRLNARNDDWLKVKPEYMNEFGEYLDCLVIGGYYGTGRRGGNLSSFLCGLRVDESDAKQGASHKFLSFFKVGGGFTANDYANVRHETDGKWIKWDPRNPPRDYAIPSEIPDVWIRPEDSVVVQAKATSVTPSDEFGAKLTLRFPRFEKLRADKNWETALSLQEFYDVRESAENQRAENEKQAEEKQMQAKSKKRHQTVDLRKRPLQVAGYTQRSVNAAAAAAKSGDVGTTTTVFQGMTIFVMTDSDTPERRTKLELEEMVKNHGGRVIQTASPHEDADGRAADEVICIGRRRNVKVAGLVKAGGLPILKPMWLFDCIAQAREDLVLGLSALPLRPEMGRHVFFTPEDRAGVYEMETDQYGDSYARDTTVEELRVCMDEMQGIPDQDGSDERILEIIGEIPGRLFQNTVIHFAAGDPVGDKEESIERERAFGIARTIAAFAGAQLAEFLDDPSVTHVVVDQSLVQDPQRMGDLRSKIAEKKRPPRVVTVEWVMESWKEETQLGEERFAPG